MVGNWNDIPPRPDSCKIPITAQEATRLVKYNPDTGLFTWLVRTSNRISVGDVVTMVSKNGYVRIGLNGNQYQAHRIAWLIMTGEWPEKDIDHINGDRIDNRWQNLRQVDRQTNLRNSSLSSANTSGALGVSLDKRCGRWYAYIKVDGVKKSLGYYDNIEDAVLARKAADVKYGFHPDHGKPKISKAKAIKNGC